MKKLLGRFIVWHRWLALPSCLFFGIWFLSGVVMMYARMPELTEADRLLHLPSLKISSASAFPDSVLSVSAPERITLGMLNGRPAYRILPRKGRWFSIYADNGSRVGELDSRAAIQSAAAFRGQQSNQLTAVREIADVDQWTVYPTSRVFLPFYLISGNDAAHTTYYVSAATGSVYLTTTLRGKFFAWCGAIPHWWYITALRSNNSMWHWVLIAASGWGVLMCIFGIAAGIMRYSPSKRYKFPGPRYSSVPHVGMKRWHYILGYGFGFITFTWILSGLFSMNPGNWSPGPDASTAEIHSFAGATLDTTAFKVSPVQAWTTLSQCLQPKEIELIMFNGEPYYLGRETPFKARLLPANRSGASCLSQVPLSQVVAASSRLAGDAPVVSVDTLTNYDDYYYDRKHQKPLPVVRVRLADSKQTWLYVNPETALIQARYTERSRWERWLYNGLHSLDFPFLFYHRPLWDLVVIVLSIGGFALSITGIVLTIRYFQKSYKKRSQVPRRA
jgi:hypothetical protein